MIVQAGLLVVQTDTGGDGKAFDKEVIVGRLVEGGETVSRGVEVSGKIDLVQFVSLDGQFRRSRVIRQNVVERFLQNPCQSVFLEDDRTVCVQAVIKTVGAEAPLIIAFCVGFDRQFFAPGILFLFLVEGENRPFRIVLVHLHVVSQILVGRGGGENETVCFPYQVQTVVQCTPPVGTRVVDADRLHGSGLRVVFPVREGFLGYIVIVECILRFQMIRNMPVQFETAACRFFFIGF